MLYRHLGPKRRHFAGYAFRYGERFSEDTDLVGLSVANLAAGLSSTFVVNGSPTKTAMVDTAGGRSQIAHLTTAATVLVVLLFLTKPLSYLPNAVLAAIVFLIGVKLIKLRGLAEIRKKSRDEYVVALAIAAIVVFIGVKEGIIAAIVLSLLDHVRQGYRPHTAIILTDPVEHWRMESVVPGKMIEPGLVMYWLAPTLLRECELFRRASVASGCPFTVARTMARGRCGGHC